MASEQASASAVLSSALRALLVALIAMFAASGPAVADKHESEAVAVRKVKAEYLYQFIAYVEWPSRVLTRPDGPVTIGVVGPDAVVSDVSSVIGERTVRGRPVVVQRVRDGDAVAGVNIVYVTASENGRLASMARAAQARGALLVTESETALDQGSMINFKMSEGRVRFDVALAPAERAGLRISSRLLAVADSVRPGAP